MGHKNITKEAGRDWLELLIVPLFIALGAALLGGLQACAQMRAEEQRAHQIATQTYLDQMGRMLLDKDRPLRQSEEGDEVQSLAQARTLAVLEGLDSDRGSGPRNKRIIVRFLYETSLIDEDEPIIELNEADLDGADLNYLDLSNANLPFTSLEGANLDHAILKNADLGGANFEGANLAGANLSNANLRYANLENAELNGADLDSTFLDDADLSSTALQDANLSGASLQNVGGLNKEALRQATHHLSLAAMTDETLHSGTYVTDEFVRSEGGSGASLSLRVGKGWQRDVDFSANPGELYFSGPGDGVLVFTSPLSVIDPSNLEHVKDPERLKEISAPESVESWVGWFQEHPNLDHSVSKPIFPATVGDMSGERIDVTYCSDGTHCSKPEMPSLEPCGESACVPLFPRTDVPDDIVISSFSGDIDRFVVIDVNGEVVIIDISAPADEFDAFLPEAQKVLETVEWEKIGS